MTEICKRTIYRRSLYRFITALVLVAEHLSVRSMSLNQTSRIRRSTHQTTRGAWRGKRRRQSQAEFPGRMHCATNKHRQAILEIATPSSRAHHDLRPTLRLSAAAGNPPLQWPRGANCQRAGAPLHNLFHFLTESTGTADRRNSYGGFTPSFRHPSPRMQSRVRNCASRSCASIAK